MSAIIWFRECKLNALSSEIIPTSLLLFYNIKVGDGYTILGSIRMGMSSSNYICI
jgi:hypothetical protein